MGKHATAEAVITLQASRVGPEDSAGEIRLGASRAEEHAAPDRRKQRFPVVPGMRGCTYEPAGEGNKFEELLRECSTTFW